VRKRRRGRRLFGMKPIQPEALVNLCAWQTVYLIGFVMAARASDKRVSVRGLGEIALRVNNLDLCSSSKGKLSVKD
jgi:hypothetical protein